MLDLVAVPLWYHVERAEGDDPQVRCEVVDVAPLETFLASQIGNCKCFWNLQGALDLGKSFE